MNLGTGGKRRHSVKLPTWEPLCKWRVQWSHVQCNTRRLLKLPRSQIRTQIHLTAATMDLLLVSSWLCAHAHRWPWRQKLSAVHWKCWGGIFLIAHALEDFIFWYASLNSLEKKKWEMLLFVVYLRLEMCTALVVSKLHTFTPIIKMVCSGTPKNLLLFSKPSHFHAKQVSLYHIPPHSWNPAECYHKEVGRLGISTPVY